LLKSNNAFLKMYVPLASETQIVGVRLKLGVNFIKYKKCACKTLMKLTPGNVNGHPWSWSLGKDFSD